MRSEKPSDDSRGRSDRFELTLLILLPLVAFFYCMTPIHNGNFFWHIENGEHILQTGQIRTADPYTFTRFDCEWLQQEWLAETAMAASWMVGGEAGPVILKGLTIALSVLLASLAARRAGAEAAAIVITGLAWLSLSFPRWIVRPHVFTIFFFSLYLYLLSRRPREIWKCLLLFIPLQVAWTNTHAGFVMGYMLLGVPALDMLFSGKVKEFAKWIALPFTALLSAFIHPNGIGSLKYIFSFLSQPTFRESIREWWSPFDPRYQPSQQLSDTAVHLMVLVLLTCLLILFRRRRIRRSTVAVMGVLALASFFASRNIELLAMACLAWLPSLMNLRRLRILAAGLLTAAVIVPMVHGVPREIGPPRRLGVSVDWEIYPRGLVGFLRENPDLQGLRAFNTNEISGYLEYSLSPDMKLFMDGRCLLYPESFYIDYLILATSPDASSAGIQMTLLDRYGIELALYDWPRDEGSSAYLLSSLPDWSPIYWDGLTIAYAHDSALGELGLEHLAMEHVDPLSPEELLSAPPYDIPTVWTDELERASEPPLSYQPAAIALAAIAIRTGEGAMLDAAVGSLDDPEVREEVERAAEGEDPGEDSYPTLRMMACWTHCRSGDFGRALSIAEEMRDPVLEAGILALELWSVGSWSREPAANLPHVPPEALVSLRPALDATVADSAVIASAAYICGLEGMALEIAEALVSADPDLLPPWTLSSAAVLLATAGRDEQALLASRDALDLARSPYTLIGGARVSLLLGDYDRAVMLLRDAVSISASAPVIRMMLARALWESGDIRGCVEQLAVIDAMGAEPAPVLAGRRQWLSALIDSNRQLDQD